jgi:polar amino acid transport system ATP-binding protein
VRTAGDGRPGFDPSAPEILRTTDLHKAYGRLEVLKGVTLGVRQGEVLVLIGRSGSGKSTFLRCVNLLEVPSRGRLEFEDWRLTFGARQRLPGPAVRQLRRRIGMVFQQFNLWPHLTAERNVALALEDVVGLAGPGHGALAASTKWATGRRGHVARAASGHNGG